MEQVMSSFWNNRAATYDDEYKWSEVRSRCADRIISELKRIRPQRAIDVGAGTGVLGALVKDAFPDVRLVLVDQSAGMLEIAKARHANRRGVEFITADFEHLSGVQSSS